MTEAATLARSTRASGPEIARLAPNVRAAVDGDWIIFFDIARNRYRAASRASAPPIEGLAASPQSPALSQSLQAALERDGLLAPSHRHDASAMTERTLSAPRASFKQVLIVARAALWARRVVRTGALLEAFAWLGRAKCGRTLDTSLHHALGVHHCFTAARIWIPDPYVCLFDSLCLMRFLLAHGLKADLVFGVRARPFAAHCWVECDGIILDDGGEDCASFAEIARA